MIITSFDHLLEVAFDKLEFTYYYVDVDIYYTPREFAGIDTIAAIAGTNDVIFHTTEDNGLSSPPYYRVDRYTIDNIGVIFATTNEDIKTVRAYLKFVKPRRMNDD